MSAESQAMRPKCGAKLRNGGSCGRLPMRGQRRCDMHGGKLKRSLAAAERRLAAERARKALDQKGIREIQDPVAEFRALVSESVAFKDLVAERVAAMGERWDHEDAKGTEQLRAEVELYERAMDRAGKFLAEWQRLGMDERLVRVHEAQAAALGKALDVALDAARVSDEQRRAILARVATELGG